MPQEVITRVHTLARRAAANVALTFADRFGDVIPDDDDDDDNDPDYAPDDDAADDDDDYRLMKTTMTRQVTLTTSQEWRVTTHQTQIMNPTPRMPPPM